ncbi:MAG: sensor histidine kinase [Anaerolineales bacterium]|nr:sensor histidine kinase [Anaerolineales bacterium]
MIKFDRLVKKQNGFFQQIQWKLMWSYTIVTVAALLVVELLLLAGGISYFVLNSRLTPRLLIEDISTNLSPVIREKITETPKSIKQEMVWLNRLGSMETGKSNPISLLGGIQLDMKVESQMDMYLLSSDSTLIETLPRTLVDQSMIGQPFDTNANPGLEEILEAALNGEQNYRHLYMVSRDDFKLRAAVPVFNTDKTQVLGVLVVSTNALPWSLLSLRDIAKQIGYSVLFFTLFAGVMGAMFGALTARGLVRRLGRLSESATAWSKGDFSVYVDDSEGDELGHLARDLNRMAQRLEMLLDKRQEMSVLEERNRLARDLHDSAKQQAFAASAQLGAARALFDQNPRAAEGHLKEAEILVDEVRQELNHLIQELRPVNTKGSGLASLLKEYSYEWAKQNNLEIEFRVYNEQALSIDIEQTLFRIAQEALANIARHSQAQNVEILLSYDTDWLALMISDDGIGFESDKKHVGLGLRSMHERAELLDGFLVVETIPWGGTTVTARCPYQTLIAAP